jgi:hypothetical protein
MAINVWPVISQVKSVLIIISRVTYSHLLNYRHIQILMHELSSIVVSLHPYSCINNVHTLICRYSYQFICIIWIFHSLQSVSLAHCHHLESRDNLFTSINSRAINSIFSLKVLATRNTSGTFHNPLIFS